MPLTTTNALRARPTQPSGTLGRISAREAIRHDHQPPPPRCPAWGSWQGSGACLSL